MTGQTTARKQTCQVARHWGNGRRSWRCNLESGHEGKHYDPVRHMYWGDVIAAREYIR